VQCVERTFQLTRADRDMVSKQEFDVEVCLDFHACRHSISFLFCLLILKNDV
jgi:hypothetical protein